MNRNSGKNSNIDQNAKINAKINTPEHETVTDSSTTQTDNSTEKLYMNYNISAQVEPQEFKKMSISEIRNIYCQNVNQPKSKTGKVLDIENIESIHDIFDLEVSSDEEFYESASDSEDQEPESPPTNTLIVVNNLSTSSLPTIQCRIHDSQHNVLLDSGAQVSVLKYTLAQHLDAQNHILHWDRSTDKSLKCRGADGSPLTTLGKAKLAFSIGEQRFEHEFLVIENLNQSIILGGPFMSENSVVLDYGSDTVTINGEKYPLGTDTLTVISAMDGSRMPYKSRSRETKVIKPNTTTHIKCLASSNTPEGDFLINPLRQYAASPDYAVHFGVTYIGPTKKHMLQITNMTDYPITIREDQPLCTMTQRIIEHYYPETEKAVNNVQFDEIDPTALLHSLHYKDIPQFKFLPPRDEAKTEAKKWPPTTSLQKQHHDQLMDILREFEDCFTDSDREIPMAKDVEYTIELTDDIPVHCKPRPCPFHLRDKLKNQIDTMLTAGTIRYSHSEYASPAFLVAKEGGTDHRFIIDFREVNKKIRCPAYPIPKTENLLAMVAGNKYYSRLDARSSFHQIKISEKSKHITAFTCDFGHFEYNSLPQGLKCSAQLFQGFSDKLFYGMQNFIMCYMDDYVIFSQTIKDHFSHLTTGLEKIRESGLGLKRSKCSFFQRQILFLGFLIGFFGFALDINKVLAIYDMATPKTLRQVRRFIGATQYYRRHVMNFSRLAEPLINLTKVPTDAKKVVKIHWTAACQQAFDAIRKALMNAPILTNPVLDRDYRLYCDASITTIGSILTQVGKDGHERVILHRRFPQTFGKF